MKKGIKVNIGRYSNEDTIIEVRYDNVSFAEIYKEICALIGEPVPITFGDTPLDQSMEDMFRLKGMA